MDVIKELPQNNNWIKRSVTNLIVLHHAEATKCSIHDIDRWHKENGWNGGCGYNFFIRKDGKVYQGRPLDVIGAHCKGYNEESIGICFEGNFEVEFPTYEQVNKGIELIRYLRTLYPNVKVLRHKDLNQTACPGNNFNDKIIIEGMKNMEELTIEQALQKLVDNKIISSPEYWLKVIDTTKFVDVLILNMAKSIK